ncbi:uncharacterized protein LOC111341663 [Stylophora pistillata]|uniref:uncharacterized protein LOC111341663 n=1 Tax=Stylophora pistillata TaxID=50429 RepID=UPI000C04C8DB|nr:uncharacterized protein LOC111341663 [Stylophora pistillata]
MAVDNKQRGVNLTRKFNKWTFYWRKSIEQRMPWFDAKGTHKKALLTTSSSPTYYPAGSIIWGGTNRHPADWMSQVGMRDPGVIWYWLNEDDCDKDRKPVDGGLTEWGDWGRCDKLCQPGKQRRFKTCTNPSPQCGGKRCDPRLVTKEERDCTYCPESGIRMYNDYCVAPNEGGCSPPDGAYLIATKIEGTSCNAIDQIFLLDEDGVIHHKCSKKVICPEGNYPGYTRKLMLKDECDLSVFKHERVSPSNAMKNLKNKFCIHPNGGWPKEGGYLVYYKGCGGNRLRFYFFDLDSSTA